MGQLSQTDCDRALRLLRARLDIAEILHEEGALTDEALSAYEQAKAAGRGKTERQLLVDGGLVEEEPFLRAVAAKHDLPFVEPDVGLVDRDLLKRASPRYISRHKALPLRISEGTVTVIPADPLDKRLISELEGIFSCRASVCCATSGQIEETLATLEQMLADEDRASTKGIAELIERDPAVTAGLLRVANSAMYGGLKEITDVAQAVTRIGMRQVRVFVSAILHKANFEGANPSRVELVLDLWQHAVSTAVTEGQLADATGGEREMAFLAGLLHDTGKLLVLRGVSHIERAPDAPEVTADVLDELMLTLHDKLGHEVLLGWNLPWPVCSVALRHHEPELDAGDRLLLHVRAANAMSKRLGYHPKPEPELKLAEEPAIELLNLGEVQLASMMVDVQDEIDRLKGAL